jgi:acetolactate synthase I/II/III large subunit
MPKGADLIAQRLADQGCTVAFGMPGGEVLALIEALDKAGIRFVLTKHENAAGFMAEGFWHAQTRLNPDAPMAPGILVTTLGPGAANGVNVVANAHQDRVPLIVLTGCIDAHEAESYTHQVFDHQALFRPVTKASLRVSAGAIDRVIDRAVHLAIEGQPGPVHLDVPISVAEGAVGAAQRFSRGVLAKAGPAASPALESARALFAKAQRPLVLAGVDGVNQQAGAAITAFCESFGAPLLTSYKGKGLMPEDHPLALGGAGLSPKADAVLLPFLREADCVILAGYDPIEMRINWRDPFPDSCPVLDLAAVSPMHQMHRSDVVLAGDVAAGLAALSDGMGAKPGIAGARVKAVKAELAAMFAPQRDWGPEIVFETLRRLAPRDCVTSADSGAHRILLSQMWSCYAPRLLLQSTALCTMGCALPLAFGHALADPSRRTLAFVGDAGFEMGIGELATARDLKLNTIIVVLQDARLALIDLKQRASQRPQNGVAFGASDFAAIANAFGGVGVNVGSKAELEVAFEAALTRQDVFTVIAAQIAPDAYLGLF